MTLNAAPWTVTVAWVAERLPDTDAFSKTSDPPAAAMNDVAAAMPSLARAGLRAGGPGSLLRGGDRDGAGVVEQRGLQAEKHHREQHRHQDHHLHRRGTPLAPHGDQR